MTKKLLGDTARHLTRSEPSAQRDIELVRREIQEIQHALEAFRAAVEAEEVTGFKDGGMRAHDG